MPTESINQEVQAYHQLWVIEVKYKCFGCGREVIKKPKKFYQDSDEVVVSKEYCDKTGDYCKKPYLCTYCNVPGCNGGC